MGVFLDDESFQELREPSKGTYVRGNLYARTALSSGF
jgi:hypothetical protein